MKITIESKRMPSFTGFWTKWVATCGKYKGSGRTEHEALKEVLKKINDYMYNKTQKQVKKQLKKNKIKK